MSTAVLQLKLCLQNQDLEVSLLIPLDILKVIWVKQVICQNPSNKICSLQFLSIFTLKKKNHKEILNSKLMVSKQFAMRYIYICDLLWKHQKRDWQVYSNTNITNCW